MVKMHFMILGTDAIVTLQWECKRTKTIGQLAILHFQDPIKATKIFLTQLEIKLYNQLTTPTPILANVNRLRLGR